jgi:alpha/beta superfamily hydrolase
MTPYDGAVMPEALRQKISIATPSGQLMRGMLHEPATGNGARRSAVLLHRGVPGADEPAGDLMETLAGALADAGVTALRFETRVTDLLLADFDAYSVADETADVSAALRWLQERSTVEPADTTLLGFGLGAVAASLVAAADRSLRRLLLLSPVHGGYIASRMLKGNGTPAVLKPEQIPHTWVAGAIESDPLSAATIGEHATLIIHAAADRFIAPDASVPYLAMLEAANRMVERVHIARADHVFSSSDARQTVVERIVRFVTQPVATPRRPLAGAAAEAGA